MYDEMYAEYDFTQEEKEVIATEYNDWLDSLPVDVEQDEDMFTEYKDDEFEEDKDDEVVTYEDLIDGDWMAERELDFN